MLMDYIWSQKALYWIIQYCIIQYMKDVILKFDDYLHEHNLKFSSIIIGGSALIVLGVIDRSTQDVDCLFPIIPSDIKEASIAFAKKQNKKEIVIKEDWLNNGPEDLARDLPKGWQVRTQTIFKGKAIHLETLGRNDLLLSKLFAYVDRQQDLDDCIALRPTEKELSDSINWLVARDTNDKWESHVRKSIQLLAKKLGYNAYK